MKVAGGLKSNRRVGAPLLQRVKAFGSAGGARGLGRRMRRSTRSPRVRTKSSTVKGVIARHIKIERGKGSPRTRAPVSIASSIPVGIATQISVVISSSCSVVERTLDTESPHTLVCAFHGKWIVLGLPTVVFWLVLGLLAAYFWGINQVIIRDSGGVMQGVEGGWMDFQCVF
jgi:hypothetical protein